MRLRNTFLAATILFGMGDMALAQSTTPAKPAAPTTTAPSKPMTSTMPSTDKPGSSMMSANEFKTEAEAKAHCPSDTVVWANLTSKAYHLTGDKYYGKTRKGAYMCMADATSGGFHKAGTGHATATSKKKSS